VAKTIITDKAMQARPKAEDAWLIESGARGDGVLVGRISPAGARTFYYRYTGSNGQRVRLPIGAFDPKGNGAATFTVAQARERARDLTALYRSGTRDLREHFIQQRIDADLAEADARRAADSARRENEAQAAAAALALERRISTQALFDRWVRVELQARTGADGKRIGRKDGGKYTSEQFGRYVFPALGDRAIADVTKADLMAILDGVKAAGKLRTANVLLADLKQMFRFALAREVVDRNPLDSVTKRDAGGTDTLRERVLSVDEITTLAKIMPAARLNPRTNAAVWLLLATGARVGELMGASWGADVTGLKELSAAPGAADVKIGFVDLDAATWHLPTTKNEREHTIHLSEFALVQLEKLHELREVRTDEDGSTHAVPWVFPNSFGTGPVCVKSFGKQLSDRQREPEKRMKGRSKSTASLRLAGGRWTAHDLRRTAGTLMASLGISGDVIDECLNHVIESRVRRTYIRDRRPAEQVRAFDALGTRLEEIISGKKAAPNVVELRAA
jgi:integrase